MHFPLLSYKENLILFGVTVYPPKTIFSSLPGYQEWPHDTVLFSELQTEIAGGGSGKTL